MGGTAFSAGESRRVGPIEKANTKPGSAQGRLVKFPTGRAQESGQSSHFAHNGRSVLRVFLSYADILGIVRLEFDGYWIRRLSLCGVSCPALVGSFEHPTKTLQTKKIGPVPT